MATNVKVSPWNGLHGGGSSWRGETSAASKCSGWKRIVPLLLLLHENVPTLHTTKIEIVHILTGVGVRVTLVAVVHIFLFQQNIVCAILNFTRTYKGWVYSWVENNSSLTVVP